MKLDFEDYRRWHEDGISGLEECVFVGNLGWGVECSDHKKKKKIQLSKLKEKPNKNTVNWSWTFRIRECSTQSRLEKVQCGRHISSGRLSLWIWEETFLLVCIVSCERILYIFHRSWREGMWVCVCSCMHVCVCAYATGHSAFSYWKVDVWC